MYLWLSLERLWAPFGSLEGAVGPSLGGLWDPFWASWAALGRLVDFIENWMSLSEQMWPKYRACAQKQASQNSPADPPETPSSLAGPTLGSTRAGARMMVVNTNSLK